MLVGVGSSVLGLEIVRVPDARERVDLDLGWEEYMALGETSMVREGVYTVFQVVGEIFEMWSN